MDKIDIIVDELEKAKQPQSEFVKLMDSFKDPYIVLIACILSLRTNDKTTYPATLRMLKLAKTPQEMMNVEEEELGGLGHILERIKALCTKEERGNNKEGREKV